MILNRHHRVPKLSEIDLKFIYDDFKISKDALSELNIYMGLSDVKKKFKVKNFDDALTVKDVICLRSPQQMSVYYTLPSVFILKENLTPAKKHFQKIVKEKSYSNIPATKKTKIKSLLDELKAIDKSLATPHKTIVIDMVTLEHEYKIDYDLMMELLKEQGVQKFSSNPIKAYDLFYELYNKAYLIKNKEYVDEKIQKEIELRRLKEKAIREEQERQRKVKLVRERKEKTHQLILKIIKENYKRYSICIDNNRFFNLCTESIKFKELIESDKNINEDEVLSIMETINFAKTSMDKVISLGFEDLKEFNLGEQSKFKSIKELNNYINRKLNNALISKEFNQYPRSTYKFRNLEIILDFKHFKNEEERLTAEELRLLKKRTIDFFKKIINRELKKNMQYTLDCVENRFFINTKENKKLANFIDRFIAEDRQIKKLIKKSKEKALYLKINIGKDVLNKKELMPYSRAKSTFLKIKEVNRKNTKKQLDLIYSAVGRYLVQNNIFFSDYKEMFSRARALDREIHYYSGVTNSGKTYTAFEELKKHNSGLYLAPLRLLALEGQEEIEKRGLTCSMLTGEEREIKKGARFISSTIEMADYSKDYDVVIIDEIQMIKDRQRGSAWLQALVGIRAKKVIVVGSPDIQKQIEFLANYLKEKLTITNFERKNPLTVDKISKMGERQEKGTAIIAFSQAKVIALKEFYQNLGNKVSIVYGSLPPEIKRENAELFKSGQTDILISTDAIAMGLNLPIKRIIFSDIKKYNGFSFGEIEAALLKQISGRAGRYGIEEYGLVTAFNKRDHRFIKNYLNSCSLIHSNKFQCGITSEIYTEISKTAKTSIPSEILSIFNEQIKFNFISTQITKEQNVIAKKITPFKNYFSDQEIVKIIKSPCFDDHESINLVLFIVQAIVKARKNNYFYVDNRFLANYEEKIKYNNLEKQFKSLDLLSNFIFSFSELTEFQDSVKEKKQILNDKIRSYAVSKWLNKLNKNVA